MVQANLILALVYLLSLILSACTPGLYPQASGLNYQLGPESGLNYAIQTSNDSLLVYLKVTDKTAIDQLRKPGAHLSYLVSRDYTRKSVYLRDSVVFQSNAFQEIPKDAGMFTFTVPVDKITFPSVLILRVPQFSATQEETFLDIPLTQKNKLLPYLLADSTGRVPLFLNSVNNTESFTILSNQPDTMVTIRQFPASFAPAIPPMSGRAPAGQPATLKVQEKHVVPITQPLRLTQPGIYLLDHNGASTSLLVEEGAFPELTSAKELIEHLLYLTS